MAFLRGPVVRTMAAIFVLLIVIALAQQPIFAALYFIGVAITLVVLIKRRLSQGPVQFSPNILWRAWMSWCKSLVWPAVLTCHLLAKQARPTSRPTAVF